jgi:hypothetical protein
MLQVWILPNCLYNMIKFNQVGLSMWHVSLSIKGNKSSKLYFISQSMLKFIIFRTVKQGTTCLHCWCSGIMQDSHSCDPGSIPGQCKFFLLWHFLVQSVTALRQLDELLLHKEHPFTDIINEVYYQIACITQYSNAERPHPVVGSASVSVLV